MLEVHDMDSREMLIDQLQHSFDQDSVLRASFALTSEIEIVDNVQLVDGRAIAVIGLGNKRKIQQQMRGARRGKSPQMFPIAFSDVACSAQCRGGPRIYNQITLPIRDAIKEANDGVDVVQIESFQIYNSVKQQIRRNVQHFYPGHSILTAATCFSANQGTAKDKRVKERHRLLVDAGQPFLQIVHGAEHAIQVGRARTRIEPVVSVQMGSIDMVVQPHVAAGRWRYVVNDILWPMFKAVSDNVKDICFQMIDIYSPMVCRMASSSSGHLF